MKPEVYTYHYEKIIRDDLLTKFDYSSTQDIPKLNSIVLNVSLKTATQKKKNLIPIILALELITGQKSLVTYSKKAIADFQLKKNMPIGCKVVLGEKKMFDFMYKLKTIVFPNIREYTGISTVKFDGHGNFALGLNDFSIFPEISTQFEKFEIISGVDIIFITSAKTDLEAKVLLSGFQLPFIK